jgi:hypothetical protein
MKRNSSEKGEEMGKERRKHVEDAKCKSKVDECTLL